MNTGFPDEWFSGFGSKYVYKSTCGETHNGETPVKVGKYNIYLCASSECSTAALNNVQIIVPLNGTLPTRMEVGKEYLLISSELQDFGGVPENWRALLDSVIEYMEKGYNVLAWCTGSHGRTGTLLASLISVLEPEIDDPIEEARKRHCAKAVESQKQIDAIFALKGIPVPDKYKPAPPKAVVVEPKQQVLYTPPSEGALALPTSPYKAAQAVVFGYEFYYAPASLAGEADHWGSAACGATN